MPQVDLSQAVEGLESAAGTVGGFSALEVSDNVAVCVAGCAFLAFKVYRVGVFFLCGMIPGVTVLLLTLNLDYGWVLALIAFVAFGILGVVLTRPYLIAITALGYGVAAGQIALALLGVEQPLLAALAGLVLAALGFVFQWKTTGEDPEQGD